MISFDRLANLGRLGNQMFQFASLKGIARHRGFDFCIPPPRAAGRTDSNVRHSDANIYNTFRLGNVKYRITNYNKTAESTFNFDQNLFDNCPDETDLHGFFQNERYFEAIEDEIIQDFTFSDRVQRKCQSLLTQPEYISLHIRRGDYVTNPNHPLQTIEYFEAALRHFDTALPVIIFSDDYQWCQTQPLFATDRFTISKNNSSAVDLCLQSMCSYHIICNSSFSWWGSYLAKSKKTIAPKEWLAASLNKDCSAIYRQNWIVI